MCLTMSRRPQQWSASTSDSLPIISESSEGNGETEGDNDKTANDLPFNVFDDDIFIYTSKDRLPTDSITSAVYSVKRKTCSGEYVGKTLRALSL